MLHFLLFINILDFLNVAMHYSLEILLLLGEDIETNPGPQTEESLKFFHWYLNSICARGAVKIPLIEAYDLIAISETMLDSTIGNDVISIEGFSREIYRADHPSDNKIGGVCLYFREGLPIKRRKDLEFLQEMIVTEITISRKKILFSTTYRSPSQNSVQFENFIDRLHRSLNVMQRERPHLMILTGDLNCQSSQWWPQDMEEPQGMALEELIETNDLHQLINEPTNIRGEAMSCIDLIITDQPNLFLQSGVHSSLDQNCQHRIIYGKINISLPPPPLYKSTLPTFLLKCSNALETLPIDKGKVLKIILSLDTKKAHGCDEISVSMIKICDHSNVIPIHKKESRQSKMKYRPISLLPIFGKIFEKLIFDAIYLHLC